MAAGVSVAISELADYEVRRELLRAGKRGGLQRLDDLKQALRYVPITTETMLQAADYWATARRQGRPTASDTALDGDVIIAAQATLLTSNGDHVIVATTNPRHLARFVDARLWSEIPVTG